MNKKTIIEEYHKLTDSKSKSDVSKQQRGRIFENLICRLFKSEGVLIREPYYTDDNRAEQIDGAIKIDNRILLLEVKWVESGLAASDLYAFIGKISNKLEGTIGIFISKELLKNNFLNAITKGRRRNTIIIHGNDIEYLFSLDFNIKEYIAYLIDLYSYDNILHLSASNYLEQEKLLRSRDDINESKEHIDKDKIARFLALIDKKEVASDATIEIEVDEFSTDEKVWVLKYLMKKYGEYREASERVYTGLLYYREANSSNIIKNLIADKGITEITAEDYFSLVIEKQSAYYLIPLFWNRYLPYYRDYHQRNEINEAIVSVFVNVIGDWDSENTLTNVIEEIWEELSCAQKKKTYWEYIEIYIDYHRKRKFDQKQFAYKLLESEFEPQKEKFIRLYLESKISKDIQEFDLKNEDIQPEVSSYRKKYERVLLQIDIEGEEEFLNELFAKSI